ncbi:hypothetical protein [Paenibacillus donghaensis]|uniref:Uncharacterized protein n=1 Tax=Paenibacillus donghaensis TaxID=414771 RepID=A0A2Z2KGR9_9BACL|nr:hypothetical protein [Paenibacillus donghaensis]ASA25404.1 hypothetical protein B9T62_34525 [Paenibacillus donghaensis]
MPESKYPPMTYEQLQNSHDELEKTAQDNYYNLKDCEALLIESRTKADLFAVEIMRLQRIYVVARETIESLYQITRRGELTDQDMKDADAAYDALLSYVEVTQKR